MVLYSDAVTSTSAGATAGTWDNVGNIDLRNDAVGTFGILAAAAPVTAEAAVAYHGAVRVSSNDLGVSGQTASCPPYEGGAPATNIGFRAYKTEFIPFVWGCGGKEKLTLDFTSQLPDPTNACSVALAVVYEANKARLSNKASIAEMPYMNGMTCRGFQNLSQAAFTAAGETAFTNSITIPQWATEIVGFKPYMLPNLMTAGEEVVGYMRMTSTMPDIEPCKLPFLFSIGAPLGTPVGKGAELQMAEPYAWSWFTTQKNETISPKVYLNVAITTGHPASCTVYYR